MRIAALTNYSNHINLNSRHVSFKGEDEPVKKYSKAELDENKQSSYNDGFISALLCLIGFGLFYGVCVDKKRENFLNQVKEITESGEIQRDRFTVKDVTGDEVPDLILYKKDGSKVVIDIKQQKILKEKKTLQVID